MRQTFTSENGYSMHDVGACINPPRSIRRNNRIALKERAFIANNNAASSQPILKGHENGMAEALSSARSITDNGRPEAAIVQFHNVPIFA
jgi:hypothetical protein